MRSRKSTPTGRQAASAIAVRLLRQIGAKGGELDEALRNTDARTDPAAAREAVATVHRLAAEIDALVIELAGVTMVAGKTAEQVRAATGIGTATLTRRVPKTLSTLRGHAVEKDPTAAHGYRVTD
ncbi:Uncharacterised protein [Mycobacteroides abscessus subsp. massiliense]|uniref:hypothetical protein n=1 Tax=Mycobacteroides abscessus TaxID=36809 RepID=UPI0009286C81|nr:hypothetical protein [Mycobacteroides abscessus]SHR63283.1 Uncharacterised protein [Mycobacteroides abscessus subsp. abscessus]SKG49689.1 Uncharacterised protein [Mycobacteroides abscessus subsp. massiliense]SKH01693.1 Uncharacterised protein [Mycobacteroides abscessus subsp. massiliense]SKH98052.1 Uncharacterised protein [Mycobacteroides abscessus subsp. massiliense]SKJ26372.1 Uncharacterised protein [Mycobacteroides abscessus subsp. massiliense]